jgi:hypothetical protein
MLLIEARHAYLVRIGNLTPQGKDIVTINDCSLVECLYMLNTVCFTWVVRVVCHLVRIVQYGYR